MLGSFRPIGLAEADPIIRTVAAPAQLEVDL